MPGPDASFFVNPYLSERRVWLCEQLALALPSSLGELKSNDGTSGKFQDWTGTTQSQLETFWASDTEHFYRNEQGGWSRDKQYANRPVFTSCEGLIMKVMDKLEAAGFGKRKGGATAFNLSNSPNGKEVGKEPAGWHWYRDKSPGNCPQPGDMFQTGYASGPKQWRFAHVGVITRWSDSEQPMWEVVHAGQGGPSQGFDKMTRTAYKMVFPMGKDPKLTLMGWLNIDEHFG